MNANHFDVSPTSPSAIGPVLQVTPKMSMSVRRFVPYVQDPPRVLDEIARPASI